MFSENENEFARKHGIYVLVVYYIIISWNSKVEETYRFCLV